MNLAQRGPTFHRVFLFAVDRAILLDRHVVVLLTAGTSLPATKALLIPLWYNLKSTIHAPGSHGCQQSNAETRRKYQYRFRFTSNKLLMARNTFNMVSTYF
ncbi:conserved hypothetical protein [Trichinella spiralis]|uniref:hypothetical protein n=1 Tax=Trichinella spiralis TaxID=6334 RepID=UPI0001EFB3A8|nr:conserved hypothetical protein [Trichinella spiralis]